MDDNTLKAVNRLCDLVDALEASENSVSNVGRDAVIKILADLMAKVQLNPPSNNGGLL